MKLYFDTNIIRDYLENRNQESIKLVEYIRQKELECFTSTFTMMELADVQQDTIFFQRTVINKKWDVDKFLRKRRQKNLSQQDFKDLGEYLEMVEARLPFIGFFNLDEEGWQIAQYIASHSILSAVDTIHLATAYTSSCDIIITNDTQFIKYGNDILKISKRNGKIKICVPEKVKAIAKTLRLKF